MYQDSEDDPSSLHPLSSTEILASLGDETDVVAWVNQVLDHDLNTSPSAAPLSLSELDRRVTHLVGTLELASEDTSSRVERIINDISRGASRLTYDLHFMRDNAISLQALLQNVETRTNPSVTIDTSAALEQLHSLHVIKQNILAAREVLREAESWGTLESDVTSLLSEQNYERAAERLSEANKSMIVFQNTPEYDNRRTLMVSLQNQLEASLSSALVAAVNSQDVVVCRNYFSIFRNIQRESEFRNYYYGSRRAPLMELWQNIHLTDCDSSPGSPSISFSQFIPQFNASFLSILQAERTSIPAIFPDPQPTLATLITSTLSALQPTLPQRLSGVCAHYGSSALPELISIYKAMEDFAKSADKILEKIGYSALHSTTAPDTNAPPRIHNRRRSSARMSISGRPARLPVGEILPSGFILDWDQDLFEPFVEYQVDYPSLERRLLADELRVITKEGESPVVDKSQLLRERSVDIFSSADEAVQRNLAFTHGYGSLGVIQGLEGLFGKFMEITKEELATRRIAGEGHPSSNVGIRDLSDLDYTPTDWMDIQALLHLLEAVRSLRERMSAFETKLRVGLTSVAATFRSQRLDPLGADVSKTTKGALQLLNQSTLNSVKLQNLLDQLAPDSQPQSRETHLLPETPDVRRSSQISSRPSSEVVLLPDSRTALSELTRTCQLIIQDTILRPLKNRLASYPSLSSWSAQADLRTKRSGNALSDISIPAFSLSPTETMQRIAEGLLNLPRLFEVYADDEALSFSLETLPFINADLLRNLSEPPPAAHPSGPSPPHTRRSPSLSFKTPPVTFYSAPPAIELTPEAVSATWLSSLSLSLLSHLTSGILPSIRFLTPAGAAQLAADLSYLSSIVIALNVECEDLDKWKEYVELDDAVGRQRVKEGTRDSILPVVAQLRGWSSE